MTITFAGTEFDKSSFDEEADVFYLSVTDSDPVLWEETPEGHVLRYDVCRDLCGITIIGVSQHVDSAGNVRLTIPKPEEINLDGFVEYA